MIGLRKDGRVKWLFRSERHTRGFVLIYKNVSAKVNEHTYSSRLCSNSLMDKIKCVKLELNI